MSLRRKKKAIAKVVKLLNLATSTNSSESSMAFRHAESIIFQNGLSQGDIPMYQLCDRSTLFKVSWNGVPKHAKISRPVATTNVFAQRRFSEKPIDPNRAYANAKTILDDLEDSQDDNGSFNESVSVDMDFAFDAEQVDLNVNVGSDDAEEAYERELDHSESASAVDEELVNEVPYQADLDVQTAEDDGRDSEHAQSAEEDESILTEDLETECEPEAFDQVGEVEEKVSAERFYSHDNVIDAAFAFRQSGESFKETLRNQYASSNPEVPFEEDSYWTKVHGLLIDFDESETLLEMDGLESQLTLAQEALKAKRTERAAVEQEEQRERTERARIEQSFEEAIERAFQARAKAYESWESKRSKMRMDSIRAEQDAQQGFEELTSRLHVCKEQYAQHLQLKEDYRAAKIMHELRRHLALAAKGDAQSANSYAAVISIMSESGLTLRDLEFSDIRNKSLFIRLLERESAQISDVNQREMYTEEMLDKFLLASRQERPNKPSENPIERVERMLKSIDGVGQFESQKVIEQVLKIMESHQISVRDLDFGCINKYSVFVCLINWEAEQIHSLSEREKFTSSVLEEYVQYSVRNPKSSQKA